MNQFFIDLFPVIIFFALFKIKGIYFATGGLIIASILQITYLWFKNHRVEPLHLITFFLILIFGGATIYFHDDMFIKWKVSILNWLFAAAFLISDFGFNRPIIKIFMEKNIQLPNPVWRTLSVMWIVYFIFVGCLNIYVTYALSLDAWVYFKTFGLTGITILFVIIQSIYLFKHIKK